MPFLSIVLPVFEEHEAVVDVITKLVELMRSNHKAFEIIAVDDGSKDNTPDVLQKLQSDYSPLVRVISHPYNKGNGSAIRSGIRAARGEWIACMDADGQHDPHDLLLMLQHIDNYDLIVGARTGAYQGAWHRNLANSFYNAFASWMAQFPILDLTSGLRIFRGVVIKKYASLFPARYSYPTTSTLIMLKGGYSVKYVPIHVQPRKSGKSKIRLLRDGLRFLKIIVKITVLYEPLRVFIPIALCNFVVGLLLILASTQFFTRGFAISNTSAVFFVLSVVVFVLGLISEQITAIQVSLRHED